MTTVIWVPFDGHHKLPKERQPVLVKLDSKAHESGGVALGYLRYAAGDKSSPYFVCVGIMFDWRPTHWADCLPEDLFESVPGWNWPKTVVTDKQPVVAEKKCPCGQTAPNHCHCGHCPECEGL